MADVYQLVDEQRQFLGALDSATAQRMHAAYSEVLREAQRDYASFTRRLEAWQADHPSMDPRGASPSRHWVFQQERYQQLIEQLNANLTVYASVSSGAIRDAQTGAMQQAQAANTDLISAAMGGGEMGEQLVSFAVLPQKAIDAVVGFTSDGKPLDTLLRERSLATGRDAGQLIVNGTALGRSPLTVAKQLDTSLSTLHWQNLRLARTEMMRAFREGQRVNMLQNADVIGGWRWSSAADKRTCPICLGQHGKVFPLKHVLPGEVPPDMAQHKGLDGMMAKPPKESVRVG